MDLESEIEKHLESKSPEDSITFLVKLWNSGSLKSPSKYETIFKYFTKHFLGEIEEIEENKVKKFLEQRHQPNCVSLESKGECVKGLVKLLKKNPTKKKIEVSLFLAGQESFKDFFRIKLEVYCKFLEIIVKSYLGLEQDEDLFTRIVAELYCFIKIDKFKELFIENILQPLNEVKENSEKYSKAHEKAVLDLLKSIFFSCVTSDDSNLDVFRTKLPEKQEMILIEAFVAINKGSPEEIGKFMKMKNTVETCEHDEVFLNQVKRIFTIFKEYEVDITSVKRKQPELFEKIAERVKNSVEILKDSMNFAEFLQVLSSFISCDAFLFQSSIYQILGDVMLREKSGLELTNYEELLSIVIKIYGKDLNQFLRKVLRAIEDRLEVVALPKKRKRKLLSGSETETTPKKMKTVSGEIPAVSSDWIQISHIWPSGIAAIFSEITAGLNVSQTIQILKQLNEFLVKSLNDLKEKTSENILFKIDFACCLLSDLFENTRMMEQLNYKQESITKSVENFNQTQNIFHDILVNIEYNNRVINAFLKLSCRFENFLMLYFYHHNIDAKSNLDGNFIGNQTKIKKDFEIIQQRIKNFGKTEEKNQLNSLLLKNSQKCQLFSIPEVTKSSDFISIFNDDKQVEFLLRQPDTRAFFIQSLTSKEFEKFSKFLIVLEDKSLKSSVLTVISQSQKLLDGLVPELLKNFDDGSLLSLLEIFDQLPLSCTSDENKKLIFDSFLKRKSVESGKIEKIIEKIFKNDSYKMFFKDFKMKDVVESGLTGVFQAILVNTARKVNMETLENFNWIVQSGNDELLVMLAKVASEIPLTAVSGVTVDSLNKFKIDLIQKLLKKFTETEVSEEKSSGFTALAKLCTDNSSILKEDSKAAYLNLLQNYVKKIIKSPTADRVKLLLMTLKDAKKLNLNDEMKGNIVDTLLVYLKSTLLDRMSTDNDDFSDVEIELQMFSSLKSFKTNFQEGCVDILRKVLTEKTSFTAGQLQYSFKIYKIAFETRSKDDKSGNFVKNYVKFFDDFATKALELEGPGKACAIAQIIETNNALLNDKRNQLENTDIDEILSFLSDPRTAPNTANATDFSKYYTEVGETLFIIVSVRQNYFKSRISQFFNVYRLFLEAVYFYKNEDAEEIKPMETSLLLTLSLQLENIMKTITKIHLASIKVISLYIASSIVNIFVKNPKTLSLGYKFKVNIKNICYQLLSTFDDKTRKHIYSVADETTREVYDGLFNEIWRW